jgi:hypothetical protein
MMRTHLSGIAAAALLALFSATPASAQAALGYSYWSFVSGSAGNSTGYSTYRDRLGYGNATNATVALPARKTVN